MTSIRPGKLIGVAVAIVMFAATTGCYLPAPVHTTTVQPAPIQTVAPAQTVVASPTYGYTPQYYNGYVVYFDRSGYPFYYLNGAVTYVPRTYSNYTYLVNHYRTFGVNYQRWYSTEGYRLHSLSVNLGL